MKFLPISIIALALTGLAAGAQAAIVTLDYTLPVPSGPVAAPTSTTGDFRLNFVGSDLVAPTPNSRSPWHDTMYEDNGMYNSVSAGGSATYGFDSAQTGYSLMWGSPDDYNTLTFNFQGSEVFSLTGSDVDNPPIPGTGFVNVMISDLVFDEVVYTSARDAFEFANAVSSVPLPAAVWLMGSAMAGLGFMGFRRKAS